MASRREQLRRDMQAARDRAGRRGGFAAIPDEFVAPVLDAHPWLYPAYRAITRELGARGGSGEVRQRKLIKEHYTSRGRAASTYWRHRRQLISLGLLDVGFAAGGPRWGPGSRRRLVLIHVWQSTERRAPTPRKPASTGKVSAPNARISPARAHAPPQLPEGIPTIRSAADALAHLRRRR